ncbi:MAG: Lrp/AsnC family transcriptional regulator [Oscillospiraceae bacterium]|nr:Lrp/AsnC family transcriptional regulator [Oscillospiraceae bacterium]
MQDKLLKLLKQNARLTNAELAAMLGVLESEVGDAVDKLEKSGVIQGYTAIINEDKVDGDSVTAIIEVKVTPNEKYGYKNIAKIIAKFPEVESVHLMSGGYDLSVIVKCDSLKKVGRLVDEQISTINGVLSIATHFIIGHYKEMGVDFAPEEDERGLYTV